MRLRFPILHVSAWLQATYIFFPSNKATIVGIQLLFHNIGKHMLTATPYITFRLTGIPLFLTYILLAMRVFVNNKRVIFC